MKHLISLIFILGLSLEGNFLKIDKLVVRSIHIDSTKGLSFKNMIILFEERKDALDIIKDTFNNPKYIIGDCPSSYEESGCILIRDSEYQSNPHILKNKEDSK